MEAIKCVTDGKDSEQPDFIEDNCYEPLFGPSLTVTEKSNLEETRLREGSGSIRKNSKVQDRSSQQKEQREYESTEGIISPKFSSNRKQLAAVLLS